MSIKEIIEIPHPILRQKAKKVRRIDKSMLKIAHVLGIIIIAFSAFKIKIYLISAQK